MSQIKVSYKRHLAKTISYRIISSTVGFIALWLATGSLEIGAMFSFMELVYKPIQYYIHERIWYRYIRYGLTEVKRKKSTTDDIVEKNSDIEIKKTEKKPNLNSSGKKVLNYSSNR